MHSVLLNQTIEDVFNALIERMSSNLPIRGALASRPRLPRPPRVMAKFIDILAEEWFDASIGAALGT